MNILKVTLTRNVLLAICLTAGIGTLAFAQKSSSVNINTRFSQARFDAKSKTYTLDMEMKSQGSRHYLFGMNLRFFYDAAHLEFVSVSELPAAYALLGDQPKAFRGNADSGYKMFDLQESAAFVNGAIQLTKEDQPLELNPHQWVKVGKLNFKITGELSPGARFCPAVIWDVQGNAQKGGFLPGSDGVVITVLENNPATPQTSAPANITALQYNWAYDSAEKMPYGKPVNQECFTVESSTTADHEIFVGEKGYGLYQNYPNPFANNTVIEFVLPAEEEARLIFSDIMGRVIHTVKGDYKAGRNTIKIERSVLPANEGIFFYRLETENYSSAALKMTIAER